MSTPGFTAQSALGGTTATYRAVANMLGDSGSMITLSGNTSSLCCGSWPWTTTCNSIDCGKGNAYCNCDDSNNPICGCN
jgi:hypothetical protein